MRDYFIAKINDNLKRNSNLKIIVYLDSIDQLNKNDYELDWFIDTLENKNFKLVYSVLNNYEGLFDKIKSKLEFNEKNFLNLKSLDLNEALNILNNMLMVSNRRLTKHQFQQVEICLKENKRQLYPLYLKLLFNIVSKWSSNYKIDNDFYRCLSIKQTIKYLFDQLENIHGRILFSHCIFYLTIAFNGISESELEDILSIDDEVLTSVFEYHEPKLRRFPLALWIRIKYDLKNYLTEKQHFGVKVTTW